MAGPGADRSPWGATIDVVLRCVPAPGIDVAEADRAVRASWCGDLASALAAPNGRSAPDATPHDRAVASRGRDPAPGRGGPAGRVGGPLARHVPRRRAARRTSSRRSLDPRGAVLGPAHERRLRLAGGAQRDRGLSGPGSSGELRGRARARRLRFAGIVLAPGYLDGAEQKRRAAEASAALVGRARRRRRDLHDVLDRATPTPTRCSPCAACERRGIGTVALVCETNGGLTDHVPEADCLVSTGQRGRARRRLGPRPGDRRRASARGGRARSRRCTTSAGSCRPATRDGRRCRRERRRALPEPVLRRPRRRGGGRPRARAARRPAGTGPRVSPPPGSRST